MPGSAKSTTQVPVVVKVTTPELSEQPVELESSETTMGVVLDVVLPEVDVALGV